MSTDPYAPTTLHGKRVDNITKAALQEMERRLGYELTITQGSFNTSVGASAGTHAKGGVVDLAPHDWRNKLRVAKQVGFFGWHRPAIRGLWGEHLHIGLRGHRNLADSAARQEASYDRLRDGLKGDGPDPTPWRPNHAPTFRLPAPATKLPPQPTRTRVTRLRHQIAAAIATASDGAAHAPTAARRTLFKATERTLRALLRGLPTS